MGTCSTDSLCSEGYHPFQTFQHVRNPASKNPKQTDGPQVLNGVREWVQHSELKRCNLRAKSSVGKPQPTGCIGPHPHFVRGPRTSATNWKIPIHKPKNLKKKLQELVSYWSLQQHTITSIGLVSGNMKATFTPTKLGMYHKTETRQRDFVQWHLSYDSE
jgi:hypothetical protein